jgi:thioredoxin 1
MIAALILAVVFLSCKNNNAEAKIESRVPVENKKSAVTAKDEKSEQALVTFIELGSVNCIPCKMMQPIMKSVEEKYGEQINVVFYDVWQPDQRHYAQVYGIRFIPTQVFLDQNGDEIFRHEGFFPEAELDAFLQKNGLVPREES